MASARQLTAVEGEPASLMLPFPRFPYRQLVADTHKIAFARISPVVSALSSLTYIDEEAIRAWRQQWLPAMPKGEI
jgi:hypothetical protein